MLAEGGAGAQAHDGQPAPPPETKRRCTATRSGTRTPICAGAMMLDTLGEKEAAEVLKYMGANEVQRLGMAIFFHGGRAGIEPEYTHPYALMRHYEGALRAFPELDFDRAASRALDQHPRPGRGHRATVELGDQRDGPAGPMGATRPPDAMDVLFRCQRDVVVHDRAHHRQVRRVHRAHRIRAGAQLVELLRERGGLSS